MAVADTADRTVQAGAIYRLDDFKRRVGWGSHAMRAARRNGLRVIYTGGRAYVRGDDAVQYFSRLADEAGQ